MEDFKILTENELATLTSKQRREYQKQLREYNNAKMVNDIVNQTEKETPEVSHLRSVSVTPEISVSTKKKSNAGRKAIDSSEKKQQIMLTIEAETKGKLESVDSKNFKKLLARYIDKNIDLITEELKKL